MFELLNQDLFGTTLLNWLLVIAAAAAITALVRLVELQAILVEAEKVGRNWGSAP